MQNNLAIDGNEIATWHAEHVDPPCLAVNMTEARKQLEGYRLSDKEKTEISHLMGAYGILVEQLGLAKTGDTEFDAIANLFNGARI